MDFVASREQEMKSGWRNRVGQFLHGLREVIEHLQVVGEELLYDLRNDPWETRSLAGEAPKQLIENFRQIVARTWNLDPLRRNVLASQQRRLAVHKALQHGTLPSWNYEPHLNAQEMYVRNDIASVEKRRARL